MKIGCVYSVDDYAHKLPVLASVPFGIAFVATALQKAGHEIRLLVVTPQTDLDHMLGGCMRDQKPGLMCLTAVSSQFPKISAIAAIIKKISPETPVLLGGHHATLNPAETIKAPWLDAICIGEGEKAAVEYADAIQAGAEPRGIHNLWIKTEHGRAVEKNEQDPFCRDLDALPPIDRGMWDEWVEDKSRLASVLVGRGCPNRCTYCSNHALAKIAKGRYVRFRSPENVAAELEALLETYPDLGSVFLEIETFTLKLEVSFQFCDALEAFNAKRERPITFGTNIAVSKQVASSDELMERLKRANFEFVNVGLESGSEKVRNEILRRPPYTNAEFLDFCRLAGKHGIAYNIFVLMGIPGETVEDYYQTVDMIRKTDSQHVFLSIFYPYPGTDLHTRAKEMGLLGDDILDPSMERYKASMDLPGFSKKRLQREYLLFPYKAFKGKKPLINIMAIMARLYVGSSPLLNSIYRKAIANKYIKNLRARFATFNK